LKPRAEPPSARSVREQPDVLDRGADREARDDLRSDPIEHVGVRAHRDGQVVNDRVELPAIRRVLGKLRYERLGQRDEGIARLDADPKDCALPVMKVPKPGEFDLEPLEASDDLSNTAEPGSVEHLRIGERIEHGYVRRHPLGAVRRVLATNELDEGLDLRDRDRERRLHRHRGSSQGDVTVV